MKAKGLRPLGFCFKKTQMEKYLYFRTVTNIADDDADGDSVCFPLSSLLGMQPANDGRLALFFIPIVRISGGVTDGSDFTNADSVVLNLNTANNHKQAIKGLIEAFNKASSFGSESSNSDFIVVGDDITGEYIIPEVLTVGAITIGAAFS
tara:strand:- start:394 stop:843 length:450 start_codon:yes stop_codon:yes gene_type:complete